MSDISSPPLSPLPEALNDPTDPNDPDRQDADPPSAPIADPTRDVDVDSDNESILSDIDEAQFEDFDPANISIEDRPAIAVDEDNVRLLGRHKRKREEGADGEVTKKKKKEGRREKVKKSRKRKDSDDDDFSGGQEIEGKRKRKPKAAVDGTERRTEKVRERKERPEENEDALTPEERMYPHHSTTITQEQLIHKPYRPKTRPRPSHRRSAQEPHQAPPSRRRHRTSPPPPLLTHPPSLTTPQDLSASTDEEIASLRARMAEAAELDVRARASTPPKPASHKLRLLPEVTALLNRNSRDVESAIVDPENNLLESVRFFLEPLSDGSLPAYNIQRELFAALARLPIDKEALKSSGIGKVVLFYQKSPKPELGIKRQAERLMIEWTRPLLKRSDDYRKRALQTVEYDPLRKGAGGRAPQQLTREEKARAEREKMLAMPVKNPNRARVDNEVRTFTVAPRSSGVQAGVFARPLGASGEDAFRRMKARGLGGQGKGRR